MIRRTILEGSLDSTTLTVVMPVRVSSDREDIIDRLEYALLDSRIPRDEVTFLVVDDGSGEREREALLSRCNELRFAYLGLDTQLEPFSIARARNYGAMHAGSKYILFQDVDLMTYDGFYEQLLREIEAQRLQQDVTRFLMFGVVYLTEEATRAFLEMPSEGRRQRFLQAAYEDDRRYVEKISTGTSVVLMNREYYLARGGNDEDFREWGFDDHEFICRCALRARQFAAPREFLMDYRNFRTIDEYRGWRSVYRLFGDMTFMKGLALFHAWHDLDLGSDYARGRDRNEQLFHRKLERFLETGEEPTPLPSICEGRTLLFSTTNPFVYNREVLPRLGEIFVEDEKELDGEGLLRLVAEHRIDRVLFHNPYASAKRLELYRAVRDANVPLLVAERGALRESVFFDPGGFNAESPSYHADRWDRELTDEERHQVEAYIREERRREDSLEGQASRVGARRAAQDLGLQPDDRVLFVPLQRPSDTVIEHFSGPIGGQVEFLRLVAGVAAALEGKWRVVVKKHPLEDNAPMIPNAVSAHDHNVKDLLDLCDAVLVINSGVGVLGMMWERPVLYAGEVFYGHEEINRQVSSVREVVEALESPFRPSREKMLRFIAYLINEFYSFGKFVTRETPWRGGGRMTVTTDIDFYQIRNIGRTEYVRRVAGMPTVPTSSILFDRYRPDLAKHGVDRMGRGGTTSLRPGTSTVGMLTRVQNWRPLRRLRKLRRSPKEFFADSKSPWVEYIRASVGGSSRN